MRLLVTMLVAVIFLDCNKPSDQNPAPTPPTTTIQTDKTSISLSGSSNTSDSFNIQTNEAWTVNFIPSNPTWLNINAASGNGNKKIIITTTQPNNTGSDRSVTIRFSTQTSTGLNINVTQRVNDVLSIIAITPNHGPANTLVTITGTGFNSIAALDTVFFNGMRASVLNASPTSLTAKVPVGAGTGNVSVKVGNSTASGPVFNYELSMIVTVIAGYGNAGINNGIGTAASFATPMGLALDSSGNIFVADLASNQIRKITPAVVVTTFAGNPPQQGNTDGQGTNALFDEPVDVSTDVNGNVFVADYDNNRVRKITSTGLVSTYRTNVGGPTGIAVDASGNIYLACPSFGGIRKIDLSGTITDIGGIYGLFDVTLDNLGNMYAVQRDYHQVYKITPSGTATAIAGVAFNSGFNNGPANTATFNKPRSIAIDQNGNLFIADVGNNAIRKIDASGNVTTYLANVSSYTTDGNYFGAYGVAVDKNGVLHISNTSENKILKVTFQ